MRTLPPGAVDALAPLRDGLRARAEAAARDDLDRAERAARARADEAALEAEEIVRRAVEAGTAAARSDAALRSARERRRAHELELAGREGLRRELERRVIARARELRDDPSYPALLATLRARALATLGPDAAVEEHPDGGIIATSGARGLDLSLPSLGRSALESMAGEVSSLWMP